MPKNEFLVFLDESEKDGKYYSNFYGGVIVGSAHYERITSLLQKKKTELNFFGEVKWGKVSAAYLHKYAALVETFFSEVIAGNLRIRIMFRQNADVPQNLTRQQIEGEYFMLYYQFVKHAFGFMCMPESECPANIRLYFDDLPDKEEKRQQFKGYVLGLAANHQIASRQIQFLPENITEVRSHDHVLLQCLDIVLGAMAFRLNDKHLEKAAGKRIRGNKTIAKERLYEAIRKEIVKLKPNFNIGASTGTTDWKHGKWRDPYTHWKFVPAGAIRDPSLTKPKK